MIIFMMLEKKIYVVRLTDRPTHTQLDNFTQNKELIHIGLILCDVT